MHSVLFLCLQMYTFVDAHSYACHCIDLWMHILMPPTVYICWSIFSWLPLYITHVYSYIFGTTKLIIRTFNFQSFCSKIVVIMGHIFTAVRQIVHHQITIPPQIARVISLPMRIFYVACTGFFPTNVGTIYFFVAEWVALWRPITQKLKIGKIWYMIFHSIQHIPHPLCKYDHFWGGGGLHIIIWEKSWICSGLASLNSKLSYQRSCTIFINDVNKYRHM